MAALDNEQLLRRVEQLERQLAELQQRLSIDPRGTALTSRFHLRLDSGEISIEAKEKITLRCRNSSLTLDSEGVRISGDRVRVDGEVAEVKSSSDMRFSQVGMHRTKIRDN